MGGHTGERAWAATGNGEQGWGPASDGDRASHAREREKGLRGVGGARPHRGDAGHKATLRGSLSGHPLTPFPPTHRQRGPSGPPRTPTAAPEPWPPYPPPRLTSRRAGLGSARLSQTCWQEEGRGRVGSGPAPRAPAPARGR